MIGENVSFPLRSKFSKPPNYIKYLMLSKRHFFFLKFKNGVAT